MSKIEVVANLFTLADPSARALTVHPVGRAGVTTPVSAAGE